LPFLATIETRPAPFLYTQSEVTAGVVAWLQRTGADVQPQVVERLFERAGVAARASLRPLEEVFTNATFAERNSVYREAMIGAGTEIARSALRGARLTNVDLIVSSSCTGFMIPAVDAHIASGLNLGPRLARLPITEAGCAGGAVALARAGDFVKAHPASAALVVAVEFSSLTFQAGDSSPTNMVAAALFADGSAAAVLVGADHPAARDAGVEFLGAASFFLLDSLGAMGYDVVESGLKLVLDKRLPDFLRGKLRPLATEFLARHGLRLEDVASFAVHPGGRKVLDVAEEELGLAPHQLEPSRSVLRDHGNMSSATILFVMERAFAGLPEGAPALAIGFGPGFGIELSLWRGVTRRKSARRTAPPNISPSPGT
jgi:alkylresorcinol/alkylpyrone synthase